MLPSWRPGADRMRGLCSGILGWSRRKGLTSPTTRPGSGGPTACPSAATHNSGSGRPARSISSRAISGAASGSGEAAPLGWCWRAAPCPGLDGSRARPSTTRRVPRAACRGRRPALLASSETRSPLGPPGLDLQVQVGGVAPRLRDMGVAQGDRVAPYLANVPEATASLVAARVSPRFSSTPMITAAAHAPSTDGSWFARSGAGCPRLGIWWCCRTCLRVRLARLWEPACGMN
jgi:hypothetical protein